MGKKIETMFSDKSLDILKEVDSIYRDSIINLGLSLVSKTDLYKTITGKGGDNLEEVTGLDILDEEKIVESKSQIVETPVQKPTTSWDEF